jgi:1,4-dihydroxy-2-naphthoate octaprenyltransferase
MADPADPEDCCPHADGELPEGSSGLVPEGPGLGLAAPLIGSLIGLLTLVVPLFAVLDDRPGHPLSPPLGPHQPALAPGSGPALATTLVLFCSHFHQVEEDAAHGKRSPVVRLGTARAAALVPWFVAGSLALQWAPVLVGQWPLTALLGVAGLPPAQALIRLLRQHHREPERIVGSKFLALRFQALNGLGLALGLAMAPLLLAGR